MTIPEELDRLTECEKKATPRPWRERNNYVMDPDNEAVALCFASPADALIVAEARNALPAIIREIRLLREALERADAAWLSKTRGYVNVDGLPDGPHPLLSRTRKLGEPV